MRQALERLNREARRLDSLTGDLLVLATLEAREASSGYRVERLDRLVLESAAQLGVVAVARGITWQVECGEQIEMKCDAPAIDRMLRNLMDNAIKYSPAGGMVRVTLRKSTANAPLPQGSRPQERIEFIVADVGAGIAEEDLPHVFRRFYRGDRTRSTPGTGLGLAIVKAVADAHGGVVRIDSVAGEGTTVTVSFPATIGVEEGTPDAPARDASTPEPAAAWLTPGVISRIDEIIFDLLTESESDLGILASDKGVSWQILCDEPVEIEVNRDAVRRAILKMIESAVRCSPEGGMIEIEVQTAEEPWRHAGIIVRHAGDDLPERLPIVEAVAVSSGGTLDVEHLPDAGTTITMRLPL
jgi:signal transduction histidine kinase